MKSISIQSTKRFINALVGSANLSYEETGPHDTASPTMSKVVMPQFDVTWGEDTTSLKLEKSFDEKLIKELREANHQIELVSENSSLMGHAGCVVRHIDGSVEAASDPRSDGIALAG